MSKYTHVYTAWPQAVYERVARGMLHTDRLTFALLLCRIQLKGTGAEDTLEQQFGVFLRGREGFVADSAPLDALSPQQHDAAARLGSRCAAAPAVSAQSCVAL